MVIITLAESPCNGIPDQRSMNVVDATARALPARAPSPARVMAACSSSAAGRTVSGATKVSRVESNPCSDKAWSRKLPINPAQAERWNKGELSTTSPPTLADGGVGAPVPGTAPRGDGWLLARRPAGTATHAICAAAVVDLIRGLCPWSPGGKGLRGGSPAFPRDRRTRVTGGAMKCAGRKGGGGQAPNAFAKPTHRNEPGQMTPEGREAPWRDIRCSQPCST